MHSLFQFVIRCVVIVPKAAAPGNPWSWQGCYWNHQPQAEVELLRRGFHIAYISANATLRPGKEWDAWYAFLTEKHGLSTKPAFVGMSRGGEYAYTWATANPDKVSCIYADNPVVTREAVSLLGGLAKNERTLPLGQCLKWRQRRLLECGPSGNGRLLPKRL